MHLDPKIYFVYIMSNRSKTLYTGVTNSLFRRVRQHKEAGGSEFTARYKLDRLVYFERLKVCTAPSGVKSRSKDYFGSRRLH
jgi:predicted GIY-YIG superfamily endonuclease